MPRLGRITNKKGLGWLDLSYGSIMRVSLHDSSRQVATGRVCDRTAVTATNFVVIDEGIAICSGKRWRLLRPTFWWSVPVEQGCMPRSRRPVPATT